LSHGAGFWAVGYAFTVVMAFATVPTPLYVLYAARDHLSPIVVTCVFAAYAVGVVAALMLVGHVSDWVGRRRMLLSAAAVSLASAVLFAASTALWALFVARAVSGFAVGIVTTTATAHLAELDARHRPAATARRAQIVAVAANLGGIGIGPVLSGLLVQVAPDPLRTPYLVGAALLLVALLGLALTPETVTRDAAAGYRAQRIAVPHRARAAFAAASLGAAVSFTIFGMFSALVPGFVADRLHQHSHLVAGAIAASVFLASAIAQVIGNRPRPSTATALAAIGLATLAISTWTTDLAGFVVGAIVTGTGAGLLFKTLLATVIDIAPAGNRGEVLAGFFLTAYVGLAAPVIGLGLLEQIVSTSVLMTVFAAVSAVALTASAAALRRTSRRLAEELS
jgi:MFS family permease